jgi:hypothetical protein
VIGLMIMTSYDTFFVCFVLDHWLEFYKLLFCLWLLFSIWWTWFRFDLPECWYWWEKSDDVKETIVELSLSSTHLQLPRMYHAVQ